MRRMLWVSAALLGVLLMTGCPFESTVPLGAPGDGSLDPALLGWWVMRDASGAENSVTFYPFDGTQYYVELQEKGKAEHTERYRVYTVAIGGERLLNISEIKDGKEAPTFFFARYGFTKEGALSLKFLGDKNIPEALGKDPQALVKFVSEHLKGTFLDDDSQPDTLVRPAPKAAPAKAEPKMETKAGAKAGPKG